MKLGFLLGLLPLVGSAFAQQSQEYCDPENKICFQARIEPVHGIVLGSVFPPVASARTEFIGEIIAPNSVKWAGWSLGGSMLQSMLLVVWPNGNNFVWSSRWATTYVLPTWKSGPVITTLTDRSYVNATHWKVLFRCQQCTTWEGGNGGFPVTGAAVQSFAAGITAVDQPANANSTFTEHSDFGSWGHITELAHSDQYDQYLAGTPISSASVTRTSTSATSSSTGPLPTATPYDYIVVGAGAAGLVVADRLSEAGKKVLLLERGGPSTKNTGGTREVPAWAKSTGLTRFDIPGLFESLFGAADPWWWASDVGSFAANLIGGGTAINGMLYWYPPDSEFATSNGWPVSWSASLGYGLGKLSARLPSTTLASSDGNYYLDQVYTLVKTLLDKKGFSGIEINGNANWKDSVYGHPAYNFKNGIRNGPTGTYFQTSKARGNFKVVPYTKVHSVIRNGAQITGVRTNNTSEFPNGIASLTTKGRVVLSAGSFGSPRILFQSGIGPSDMIDVVAKSELASGLPPAAQYINLPVGYNVIDNPSVNIVFTHPQVDDYDNWQPIWDSPRSADAAQYVKNQSGIFAYSSPRIVFWKALGGSDSKTRYLQGTARPGGWPTTNLPYNSTAIFTITFYLSQGITSRGRIGIDAALKSKPLVDPWVTDPVDLEVLLTGIKSIVADYKTILPGITMITPDSTTTIDDFVKNYSRPSMNSNHWVGSTRVGTSSSNSVVDENCKVWNTNNLFVVDAGIIPGQPMSNPHASVMIVGEIGAQKILALTGGA